VEVEGGTVDPTVVAGKQGEDQAAAGLGTGMVFSPIPCTAT